MKHMLLVRVMPGGQPGPDDDPSAWWQDGVRRKIWLEGHGLRDPAVATTVRVRGDKTLITDGPFAEFKEYIAGFDIIDVPNLDDAVAYAAGHPATRFGAIEVRQVWEEFDRQVDEAAGGPGVLSADTAGTRYVLLMVAVPDAPPAPSEVGETAPLEWINEMKARGVRHVAHRLCPTEQEGSTAIVRTRGGETVVTYGPYAEITEQVAGYELVCAADLDEAIDIASRHPSARLGAVEIRPLWEDEE